MILIADSGSTKTSWCLIQNDKILLCFETEGFNPYFTSTAYIIHSLEEALPISIERNEVQKVFFYGSGCFPDKAIVISNALRELFSRALATGWLSHTMARRLCEKRKVGGRVNQIA